MNQLKVGAAISYMALGINILTGLFYTPWMIHTIGKANFGLYTLALSVISLFVFDFGLSSAVTRFIAKYPQLVGKTWLIIVRGLFTGYIFILILFFLLYYYLYIFLYHRYMRN